MEKITIASMPERFYAKNLMLKNKTLIYASVIVNNRCVKDVETKVNEAKDNAFKTFEEEYKEDLTKALAAVEAYKAQLVKNLKK